MSPIYANLPMQIQEQLQARLVSEIPTYLELAAAVANEVLINNSEEGGLLSWWFSVRFRLPTWYSLLEEIVIFQPSSAAAERVFSLVDAMFSSNREQCLEDLKKGSVMVRYNEKKRQNKH